MAENKSDFNRDVNFIREQMEMMREHLRKQKGFNSDSNVFEMDKDANGDVLVLKTVVDNNKDLPSGWLYGTYLLDGYPKTGFYTMKDGKYVFLPTKNEIDKSKEVEYKTVQDFRAALIAANSHLANQITLTSGFGAEGVIQIEGSLNGVELPTTDLYYDENKECIVSSINPGIEFRVEFVRSAEVDASNVGGVGVDNVSSDVNKSLNQSAIRDVESRNESEGKGVSIMEYGASILDFEQMKYVFNNYEFGNDNNVISKEDAGARRVLGESRSVSFDKDPRRIEAILRLNNAWIESYHMALQGAGRQQSENETAFMGESTAQVFNTVMLGLSKGGARLKMSEIPGFLFDKFGFEQAGLIKVVLHFICHPEVSPMFDFEMDMSPEMAVQQMDKLKNEALKQQASDMIAETENVMEMVFKPGQNNNSNY